MSGNGPAPAGEIRQVSSPEAEPVDLLAVAGGSTAKRLAPVAVVVVVMVIVLGRRRARRRSQPARAVTEAGDRDAGRPAAGPSTPGFVHSGGAGRRLATRLVIRNAPLLDDGTPMPTRYWLVGRVERAAVDRLESAGGVRAAEAAVDPDELAAAHAAYARRARRRHPARLDRAPAVGWRGRDEEGGQVPARPLRLAPGGWGRPGGPWVAARLPPVAAIDCGTNSTRLLVAGPAGETLERLMRITRLGQGVDRQRRLSAAGVDRTLSVLREYRTVMDEHGVGRVRMTATSAARDAANRDEFFAAAAGIVGVRPELLPGRGGGAAVVCGGHRRACPGVGAVAGRRHRRWLHRADRGSRSRRRAPGRVLARRGLRTDHRTIPRSGSSAP